MAHLSHQIIAAALAGKDLRQWEADKFKEIADDPRVQKLVKMMNKLLDHCAHNRGVNLAHLRLKACQRLLVSHMCDVFGIEDKPQITFIHDKSADANYGETNFGNNDAITINAAYWHRTACKKDSLVTAFHEFAHVISHRFQQVVPLYQIATSAMAKSMEALTRPYQNIKDIEAQLTRGIKGRKAIQAAKQKAYDIYATQPEESLPFAAEKIIQKHVFPKIGLAQLAKA